MPVLEIVRSESPATDSHFSNSPASLRVELRERIERFDALDARHRIAKEIHERAEKALSEAPRR